MTIPKDKTKPIVEAAWKVSYRVCNEMSVPTSKVDQLIQCERYLIWLCADCRKIPYNVMTIAKGGRCVTSSPKERSPH